MGPVREVERDAPRLCARPGAVDEERLAGGCSRAPGAGTPAGAARSSADSSTHPR
jgi:hypothetical protein